MPSIYAGADKLPSTLSPLGSAGDTQDVPLDSPHDEFGDTVSPPGSEDGTASFESPHLAENNGWSGAYASPREHTQDVSPDSSQYATIDRQLTYAFSREPSSDVLTPECSQGGEQTDESSLPSTQNTDYSFVKSPRIRRSGDLDEDLWANDEQSMSLEGSDTIGNYQLSLQQKSKETVRFNATVERTASSGAHIDYPTIVQSTGSSPNGSRKRKASSALLPEGLLDKVRKFNITSSSPVRSLESSPTNSQSTSSSTISRKRKASNTLLPLDLVEKAPRNSLEDRRSSFVESSSYSSIHEGNELGPLVEASSTFQYGNMDVAVSTESLENAKQRFRDAEDLAGYEEQKQNGSGINPTHDLQAPFSLPNDNNQVQLARAASEPPCRSSAPLNIRKPKRRATIQVVNLLKHRLASSTLYLSRYLPYRRNLSRNPIDSGMSFGPRIPNLIRSDFSLPLYEAVSVASMVIYWPEKETQETNDKDYIRQPSESAGLEEIPKYLPNGGTIFSIHQPGTSLVWLEENFDLPIVKVIRDSEGLSGPLAMMLSPEEPALAIFGEPAMVKRAKLAQKLANKSNFPVIARLPEHDPMLSKSLLPDVVTGKTQPFIPVNPDPITVMTVRAVPENPLYVAEDVNQIQQEGGNSRILSSNGGENETDINRPQDGTSGAAGGANNGHDAAPSENDRSNGSMETLFHEGETANHIALGKGPGNNDDNGDPDDDGNGPGSKVNGQWEDWVSPFHKTTFNVDLLSDNGEISTLTIGRDTQFRTYADGNMLMDPEKPWARENPIRPQAQAHTRLEIKLSPQVNIDRSHAVLGFEADREFGIPRWAPIACGFDKPSQTYKQNQVINNQHSLSGAVGIKGIAPAPTATVTYGYGRSTANTIEATDSKPMPPFLVQTGPGETRSAEDGRCYRAYNYSYVPRPDVFCADSELKPPVDVGFALGLNLHDDGSLPPKIGHVNRNQIFLWVQDPSLRSKTRGMILMLTPGQTFVKSRQKFRKKISRSNLKLAARLNKNLIPVETQRVEYLSPF
ncbi:hypothetical protein C8R43DRAFT_644647 [Mycena crocata]|nr:hypothetical protein C8R43DRAFT_644647 [Mycena crocata]